MNINDVWHAILKRDASYDGKVVYAVRSTGIYCRPSCPSRKPRRANVLLFSLPEVAEQAGFRACRRCQPDQLEPVDPQVALARDVCRYIERHLSADLTLEDLGGRFGYSPHHLQRTFKRVVGVSPLQYAETCRVRQLKSDLKAGDDITGALYAAGYGSSSRLYAKANAQFGMTPGRYQQGGEGSSLLYTVTHCSLGYLLVAATDKGICAVRIGDREPELEAGLRQEFDRAEIRRDDVALSGWVAEILRHLDGEGPHLDLPLDIQATAFQRRVWQALQAIPYGSTRTYREIAAAIGRPTASRAVARACAANPVALLIPCHRVIRANGGLGGYRWGAERKRALFAQEERIRGEFMGDTDDTD